MPDFISNLNWKKILLRNEIIVLLTIAVLSAIIASTNPLYFTWFNAFRLLRSMVVPGILAMGVLIVLISGGIDVSFTAIAVFALYGTVSFMNATGLEQTIIDWQTGGGQLPLEDVQNMVDLLVILAAFGIGSLIGIVLGFINAVFISFFRLPTLLVTLGTLYAFQGFLLFFIGSAILSGQSFPEGLKQLSSTSLLSVQAGRLNASLNVTVLILLFFVVLVFLLLRYTMLGRGIYALGGAPEAAERMGFDVRRIKLFIYVFVGFLAGIGGIISGGLNNQADPTSLIGTELNVLAAVVLGGASIAGGRGNVFGALLGLFLITIVNNNLVMLGIPSEWRTFVVGVLIILGVGIPAIQEKFAERQKGSVSG